MTEPTTDERAEPTGAGTSRPRWILALAVTTALVAGTAGGALWLRGGDDLPRKPPEIITVLPPFSAKDATFSVGLDVVDKGKDIEILEVQVRATANVEYLGADAIWPRDLRRGGQPGAGEAGWPAGPHSRHPIDVVVPAGELEFVPPHFGPGAPGDLFVQAGFRLTSGDLGGLNGLRLRYKVGGKTKSKYYPWGVIVCAKPNRCGNVLSENPTAEDQNFYKRAFEQLGLVPQDAYSV